MGAIEALPSRTMNGARQTTYTMTNAPMEDQLRALELLNNGVKPEELAQTMKAEKDAKSGTPKKGKSKVKAPAPEDDSAAIAEAELELWNRYLIAFLRFGTRQIEGLQTREMEDIACLIPKDVIDFAEWKQRRNV